MRKTEQQIKMLRNMKCLTWVASQQVPFKWLEHLQYWRTINEDLQLSEKAIKVIIYLSNYAAFLQM